jgi:(heptosyl)LPS beta-1,4-glucosyltransferase
VVVDSESTDGTADLARAHGAKVYVRPFPGYAAQRTFGDEQATGDWVLHLDADERVTPELREKIQSLLSSKDETTSAFTVRRRNSYLGRWLKHSGWYPDRQLRLYRRGSGRWRGDYVHESFQPDGTVGRLDADLLHFSVASLAEHHARMNRYTDLAAAQLLQKGAKIPAWRVWLLPPLTFLKVFLLKLGFLDGFPGFCVAWFAAHYVFLKYGKARTRDRESGIRDQGQDTPGRSSRFP